MYSVLNTLSEHPYFYISKNITSYTFLLLFKIVESFQCILKSSKKICEEVQGFLFYCELYTITSFLMKKHGVILFKKVFFPETSDF